MGHVGAGPGLMDFTVSAKDKVVTQGSKISHKNLWGDKEKATQEMKFLLLGEAMSGSGTPDLGPNPETRTSNSQAGSGPHSWV